jgi:8-oxo-dGTP pyrophosphatase MutT (NUDIX family)
MRRRVMVFVYGVFGRLPRGARRRIVRAVSPKFTAGAVCFVQRDDGAVLLVRHSYHRRWGTVGGLAKRNEAPDLTAVRETWEEAGLEVVLVGEPAVVVEPVLRRVDVVYRARPAAGVDPLTARPVSAEILEVRWFPPGELPELSSDTATAWVALLRRTDLARGAGL